MLSWEVGVQGCVLPVSCECGSFPLLFLLGFTSCKFFFFMVLHFIYIRFRGTTSFRIRALFAPFNSSALSFHIMGMQARTFSRK